MARIVSCALLSVTAVMLMSCADAAPLRTTGEFSWLQQIEQQAIDDGVAPQVVHEALDNFSPNLHVVELDQKQPETTISFAAYRNNTVTATRIKKGAELLDLYASDLSKIVQRTGVPPSMVVALWGIESSFGQVTGNFETINSLATLAYEGRRADFFRGELIIALHILERDHLAATDLRGSWAGAMGQCQFMPSTYLRYAVTAAGNGHSDIWNNPIDVLASIANYLAAEGWQQDSTWGLEVAAPHTNIADIGIDHSHLLSEWAAQGITNVDGSPLPLYDRQASLLQPDGPTGQNFLVYDNIRALLRWNHSTYFALSVGLLADRIKSQNNR